MVLGFECRVESAGLRARTTRLWARRYYLGEARWPAGQKLDENTLVEHSKMLDKPSHDQATELIKTRSLRNLNPRSKLLASNP